MSKSNLSYLSNSSADVKLEIKDRHELAEDHVVKRFFSSSSSSSCSPPLRFKVMMLRLLSGNMCI